MRVFSYTNVKCLTHVFQASGFNFTCVVFFEDGWVYKKMRNVLCVGVGGRAVKYRM